MAPVGYDGDGPLNRRHPSDQGNFAVRSLTFRYMPLRSRHDYNISNRAACGTLG
jgi:hypothetical protein